MFNKILIANRGEIACRIIRTARRLGVTTVAVYSDADRNALHVRQADEAIHIGPAPARESYLLGERIIAAAQTASAEAIHPGYGFLSENAEFARACTAAGIAFIGPGADAIEAMGSKAAAKKIMERAAVPLLPGYHDKSQDAARLRTAARVIGYPVLLKATAGGGGKGMRIVTGEEEFDEALAAAKREALAAFGDDRMLVEKYLQGPRHVEVQVFFDQQGNGIYLGERDCSLQRRHQKVIEEAPAPDLAPELRQTMGEAAVRAGQAIDYRGAGTVEFLLDRDGKFFFMEMNTRLQVEHPVTEMITGEDLVEWQLRVACGEPLPLTQERVQLQGHAFEARVYAEDPDRDFLPATGILEHLQAPLESSHIRVDTGVCQGDEISVHYDPLIAKLVVWDESRERALQRLASALVEYRIGGTVTNLDFLYNLATCAPFVQGRLSTQFIDEHRELILHERQQDLARELPMAALALVLHKQQQRPVSPSDPYSPWLNNNAWRLNEPHVHRLTLEYRQGEHPVEVEQVGDQYRVDAAGQVTLLEGSLEGDNLLITLEGHQRRASMARSGDGFILFLPEGSCQFREITRDTGETGHTDENGGLRAPMNGTIVTLLVEPGEDVNSATPLLVMEAMKMEHTIRAPGPGTVHTFHYLPGDLVDGGAVLLNFSPREE